MFKVIHALILLDESGSIIYHWKHSKAHEKIIKKFVPELIGSFVSALISFGSEILEAPRYIDMGIAGASIVNLRINNRPITAFVIADREDAAEAINRFVIAFKEKAEKLLSNILSVSETGAIFFRYEDLKKLDKLMEETVKKETRWLPRIRSENMRAFLFGFLTSIPVILIITDIAYYLISAMLNISSVANPPAGQETYAIASLFLVSWWIPCIIMGVIIGYLSSKPAPAFFSGLLGYMVFWGSLSISSEVNTVAFLGGAFYSIVVAIFAFVSGRYFDSIKLNEVY